MIKESHMRVILTGANGFVGIHLKDYLTQRGHKVFCLSSSKSSKYSIESFLKGQLDKYISEFNPNSCIHLAAIAHKNKFYSIANENNIFKVNAELPLYIAKYCIKFRVSRFIYLSSIGVHGLPREPINELTPITPLNLYSRSKYFAECSLVEFFKSTIKSSLVIIRPPLIYGAKAKGNLRKLYNLVKTGLPIPLGEINNYRSLIGINNLCSAIEVTLIKELQNISTFVISDNETISTFQLIKNMESSIRSQSRIYSIPKEIFNLLRNIGFFKRTISSLIDNHIIDSSLFKETLGWRQPLTQHEEMLICYPSKKLNHKTFRNKSNNLN
ncbi:NAD-dependent epimerase/dehydratase family protein [Prochlorococcus sp. MIT 1011]|uniref:NAD-dependent epimerase/dehydratase family protein n=1 Tax=Prochlorococcus sp. MIT 1011 TaxID=3082520 RepID=UPI0039B65B97